MFLFWLAPLAQTTTTTITNTYALETAHYYTTTLPSGGSAVVVMTATAGELGIMGGLALLATILAFNTLRDMFRRVKATR